MNYALMKFRYHNLQFVNDGDDDDVSPVIFEWAICSNISYMKFTLSNLDIQFQRNSWIDSGTNKKNYNKKIVHFFVNLTEAAK